MEKSRSDWHGRAPAERFCAGCGEKLVLNAPGGLWLREFPAREVLHFACQKHPKERIDMGLVITIDRPPIAYPDPDTEMFMRYDPGPITTVTIRGPHEEVEPYIVAIQQAAREQKACER